PPNTRVCPATNSCIQNTQCCTNADCSGGQTCVGGPPGTCQCPAGTRFCSQSNSCIPNANCCTNSDCPLTANTTGTACNAGACQITGCAAGFFNVDGSYSDGCECQDQGGGNACGTATGLGSLALGASVLRSGNLPAAGAEDWYIVTFTGNTSTAYHP